MTQRPMPQRPMIQRPVTQRRAGRAAAALALFAGATLLAPSRPTAATGGAFRGVAAAEGVRIGVTAVGAPVTNNVVDGASPIAQASVDSTAGSAALASVAYPGDVVVTTPGLLAGVSGGQLSGIPPYPLLATAGSTTTPEQVVEGPGSRMRAAAADRKAEATAHSGAAPLADGMPAPASVTSASVEADEAGAVVSTAAAEVTAVAIGPLALGQVKATSVVRRAPGAEPVRETSFEATGVNISGTAVALTPAGLVVAGTTTPVSMSPLQPVLDGAGLSVRPLAAETTPDGVVSAGLVVTRTTELPTAISPVTVSYTFGRALAAVSPAPLAPAPEISGPPFAPAAGGDSGAVGPGAAASGGDPARPAATSGNPSPATAFGTGSPASGSGARSPAVAGASPGTGSIGGPAGAQDVAAGGGAAPPAGQAAAGPAPVNGTALPVRRVGSRLFDLSAIYLLLVAAAATAGAVIQFMRHAGVRLWTSRPG
jgi:hypothetical protein